MSNHTADVGPALALEVARRRRVGNYLGRPSRDVARLLMLDGRDETLPWSADFGQVAVQFARDDDPIGQLESIVESIPAEVEPPDDEPPDDGAHTIERRLVIDGGRPPQPWESFVADLLSAAAAASTGPRVTWWQAHGVAEPPLSKESEPKETAVTTAANGDEPAKDEVLEHFERGQDQVRATAAADVSDAPDARSDTMNARRLARLHGRDLRFVPAWKRFLTWTGRQWKNDDGGVRALALTATVPVEIRREALRASTDKARDLLWSWARQSESKGLRKAMLDLVPSEPGIAIDHERIDSNPWLLGVRNGVVDLRTGDLRPHAREDYVSRLAPAEYLDAAAPTWNAFLERILPDDDVRAFVQRAAGYSLTGDVGEEVLFFAHGSGANGKSKFLGGLLDVLGRDLGYAAPSELIAMQTHRGHPTEVAALHGKRLVVVNELDAGLRLDEARVKQLTGGDQLTARRMKEDFWSFAPRFKLWVAGNHRPRIIGTDEGIWRRVLLIPFDVVIPIEERDHHLAAKLRAELSGILRWAIDGALLWQKHGLAPPQQVLAASAEYRESQDRLADFLADRCERIRNASAPAKLLHDSYVHWCGEAGEEPVDGTLFGVMMRERGFERERKKTGRFYVGLKLLGVVYDDARGGAP
jgi:putative DNA primase/helicase